MNYSSSVGGDYTNSKQYGKGTYSSRKLKSSFNLKRNVRWFLKIEKFTRITLKSFFNHKYSF